MGSFAASFDFAHHRDEHDFAALNTAIQPPSSKINNNNSGNSNSGRARSVIMTLDRAFYKKERERERYFYLNRRLRLSPERNERRSLVWRRSSVAQEDTDFLCRQSAAAAATEVLSLEGLRLGLRQEERTKEAGVQ